MRNINLLLPQDLIMAVLDWIMRQQRRRNTVYQLLDTLLGTPHPAEADLQCWKPKLLKDANGYEKRTEADFMLGCTLYSIHVDHHHQWHVLSRAKPNCGSVVTSSPSGSCMTSMKV